MLFIELHRCREDQIKLGLHHKYQKFYKQSLENKFDRHRQYAILNWQSWQVYYSVATFKNSENGPMLDRVVLFQFLVNIWTLLRASLFTFLKWFSGFQEPLFDSVQIKMLKSHFSDTVLTVGSGTLHNDGALH